jgi:CRISPR-associated protein Csb3
MSNPSPAIRVAVDPTNPGQYFACCGLLELADRLWKGAEAWFESGEFCIAPIHEEGCDLPSLLSVIRNTPFVKDNPLDEEETIAPLRLQGDFDLRLDWWNDDHSGGGTFKTWAGQQKVVRIARAMHAVIDAPDLTPPMLLNHAALLIDSDDPKKTAAPFYFDARPATQANSIDVGFSPDAQNMSVPVFAAVEFLCLVGLQRFRPRDNGEKRDRTFSYFTWPAAIPLPPLAASAVASGTAVIPGSTEYRFRLLFRTKYLKGFLPSQPQ